MRRKIKNKTAAKMVLIATTASGVNPKRMDCFPKIGVNPRKMAELNAATIPLVRCFTNPPILPRI